MCHHVWQFLLFFISNFVPLLSEDITDRISILNFLRLVLWPYDLSWRIFFVHSRRLCSLLLLGSFPVSVSCVCYVHLVILVQYLSSIFWNPLLLHCCFPSDLLVFTL
jgi:hypothetical protein